jgi:hypothetical protein
METRVRALSSEQRQYLVEGARHGEGRWDTEGDRHRRSRRASRRGHRQRAVLRLEAHVAARRRVHVRSQRSRHPPRGHARLALTWDDLRAIADAQPEKAQQERLNVAFFARRVAAKAGKHPSSSYKLEHAGVQALAAVVGDALLAEAFFTGKTLRLQSAVDDARGEGTFSAWRRAMQEPDEAQPNKPADALKGAPTAVP